MKLWQLAYQDQLEEIASPERKRLEKEIDHQLKFLLPEDVFNEITNKIASLEALCEEEGYQAGFETGLNK